jgi:large subunit ribosomal protein L25
METTTLAGENRNSVGTRASRALRERGKLPAVIYGHGEAPESVALILHDVVTALSHGARTLEVDVNGKAGQYLIKEVQYDYLNHTPIHLDLTRVDLDERVKVRVGIELRGVPKGVAEGGSLDLHLADLEVECLVSQIPETLHPLVVDLGLGDSLLVKDLELPDGVTATLDGDDRVATVRVVLEVEEEAEASDEDEGEGESGEPERIGRVRKDDDAEEGKK